MNNPVTKGATKRDRAGEYDPAKYAANRERFLMAQAKWRAAHPESAAASTTKWRASNPERVRATSVAYRDANRDRLIITDAAYRAANKEKIAARKLAWRVANPDLYRERYLKWVRRNPEKAKASSKNYRAANRERVNAGRRAWNASHPIHRRATESARRSRKFNAGGAYTAADISALMSLQRGKCAGCGKCIKKLYHIDHITPLKLSGHNGRTNLQLLCPPCNMSKGARDPIDYAQSIGRLL